MSEFQKIAIGLLGMTHPEIHRLRLKLSPEDDEDETTGQGTQRVQNPRPEALLRAVKFAFAAFVAGARAIPMGDNGCVTRELGAYGARLGMQ